MVCWAVAYCCVLMIFSRVTDWRYTATKIAWQIVKKKEILLSTDDRLINKQKKSNAEQITGLKNKSDYQQKPKVNIWGLFFLLVF